MSTGDLDGSVAMLIPVDPPAVFAIGCEAAAKRRKNRPLGAATNPVRRRHGRRASSNRARNADERMIKRMLVNDAHCARLAMPIAFAFTI